MCGRFSLHASKSEIVEEFELVADPLSFPQDYKPSYNIAPTKDILVIYNYKYQLVKWGIKILLNYQLKNIQNYSLYKSTRDISKKFEETNNYTVYNYKQYNLFEEVMKDNLLSTSSIKVVINARIEDVERKPWFKNYINKFRVLIPANGFYEWSKQNKQPWYFTCSKQKILALAGLLLPQTQSHNTEKIIEVKNYCCVIFTTSANEYVSKIHSRMPLIVDNSDYKIWLAKDVNFSSIKQHIIKKNSYLLLDYYKVTTKVNNSSYDEVDCVNKLS